MALSFQAVKRSRVKSKQRTQETQEKVNELRIKNKVLEDKISNQEKELKFLKELFVTQAQAKSDKLVGVDIATLLKSSDEDGDSDSEEEKRAKKKKKKDQKAGSSSSRKAGTSSRS